MRTLLFTAALMGAAWLSSAASAKEEPETQPYTVLRENVSILLTNSASNSFGVARDGRALILREGRRWYRITLLPPCSRNLGHEFRIGLVHQGAWFDRGSQVLVDGYLCQVRKIDEIANPRPQREDAEAEPEAANP